eukprot:2093022-Pyramimonas_sp.AAC.1
MAMAGGRKGEGRRKGEEQRRGALSLRNEDPTPQDGWEQQSRARTVSPNQACLWLQLGTVAGAIRPLEAKVEKLQDFLRTPPYDSGNTCLEERA